MSKMKQDNGRNSQDTGFVIVSGADIDQDIREECKAPLFPDDAEDYSFEEDMLTDEEADDLLDTPEELEARIAENSKGNQTGPVLISRNLLKKMHHIPAFASVIFNPFGPTIDTLTLSYYEEPRKKEYLIRRSLHPFSEERNQILTGVPEYPNDVKGYQWFLERFTADFIAKNGVSKMSKGSWGKELIGCIPTGVLVDDASVFSDGAIVGFGHLLSRAEKLLETENENILTYGSDFWKATPQLSEMLQQIQDGYEPPVLEFPDFDIPVGSIGSEELQNFLLWWGLITQMSYQKDLYKAIKAAWYGSVNQFAGGAFLRSPAAENEFGSESDDDDFYNWWALFDPRKRK